MDAGLAAVLGAVAGALATTGAAFVSGWTAREQAKITARAEDRQQRREPRSDIYRRFIDAATDMEYHTQPGSLITDWEEEFDAMSHYAAMLERTAYKVREAWIEVALVGPAEVERVAGQIEQCSKGLAELARGRAEADTTRGLVLIPTRYGAGALSPLVVEFIRVAREALDDDGTEVRAVRRQ